MFENFSSHRASRLVSIKVMIVVMISVALIGAAVNSSSGDSSPAIMAQDGEGDDEEGEPFRGDELEPPTLSQHEIDDILQRTSLVLTESNYLKKETHIASSRSASSGSIKTKLTKDYGLDINNITATDEEIYLLAKIIECEAKFEPYKGKVAVGIVVMNRVKSSRFPNSIKSVIFQKGQFQPLVDGGWESKEPGQDSYRAALEALQGLRLKGENDVYLDNAMFFIYDRYASETGRNWFRNRLTYITTIGNHDFYGY